MGEEGSEDGDLAEYPEIKEDGAEGYAEDEVAEEEEAAPPDETVERAAAEADAEVERAAASPQGSPEDIPDNVRAFFQDQALVRAYRSAATSANRKVSTLVERSLLESAEVNGETFFIEAPGNHKHAFTSRLADPDVHVFTQAFASAVPFLERLDLSYNLLTDAGAELLATTLLGQRATSLAVLSLRGNSIGPSGCEAVCQAARHWPRLQRLDLSHNPLGREGGLALVELLKSHRGLLELLVADTEIDIVVLVALCATLLAGGPRLKVCDLENPRLTTLQEEHVVHLGRVLRVNTYISELYLGKHRMRDEGVRQLVSFLLENKTLRVLDLRCNELGAAGAQHLAVLLASDCQLAKLNLSGNRIGEKDNVIGASAIGEALQCNRMLRHLDLNHNALCGEALRLLAEAMERNSTLESLALFHNQWDQPSSYRFHQILNDRSRMLTLRADFTTRQVDLRIDICKCDDLLPS